MSNFLLEAGRQTLMLELQEASRLPERLGDDFIRAAETIIHCEGKLVVSGIGKSGHIGKKLAATFASTGTPAFFVHPAEALHGDLGMLDSRDVMLFISYSGSAKELDLIVPRLEEKSIPLLAMTGKSTSPLALAAKAVLDIAVEREACPMHLAPTSSTVNTLMLGDAPTTPASWTRCSNSAAPAWGWWRSAMSAITCRASLPTATCAAGWWAAAAYRISSARR